jgi:hypothetical protein
MTTDTLKTRLLAHATEFGDWHGRTAALMREAAAALPTPPASCYACNDPMCREQFNEEWSYCPICGTHLSLSGPVCGE